jgi:glutathione S-transferase
MLVSLIMGRIETSPMPFIARPIAKRISRKVRDGFLDGNVKRNLDFMEATLSESTWFCGEEFTAADVQMSFAVEAAEARTNLRDEYPLPGQDSSKARLPSCPGKGRALRAAKHPSPLRRTCPAAPAQCLTRTACWLQLDCEARAHNVCGKRPY